MVSWFTSIQPIHCRGQLSQGSSPAGVGMAFVWRQMVADLPAEPYPAPPGNERTSCLLLRKYGPGAKPGRPVFTRQTCRGAVVCAQLSLLTGGPTVCVLASLRESVRGKNYRKEKPLKKFCSVKYTNFPFTCHTCPFTVSSYVVMSLNNFYSVIKNSESKLKRIYFTQQKSIRKPLQKTHSVMYDCRAVVIGYA